MPTRNEEKVRTVLKYAKEHPNDKTPWMNFEGVSKATYYRWLKNPPKKITIPKSEAVGIQGFMDKYPMPKSDNNDLIKTHNDDFLWTIDTWISAYKKYEKKNEDGSYKYPLAKKQRRDLIRMRKLRMEVEKIGSLY